MVSLETAYAEAFYGMKASDGVAMVNITHGMNDVPLPVAGFAVAGIRLAVAETLNLPPDAQAYAGGVRVGENFVLAADDRLGFFRGWGRGSYSRSDGQPF